MSVFLLDVNALIALLDPTHEFHNRAEIWFRSLQPEDLWATCPITETGVLRIMGGTGYRNVRGGHSGYAAYLAKQSRAHFLER